MSHPPDNSTVFPPSGEGETRPLLSDWDVTQLAHYRVMKQLGKGGMGVVLQAEDQQLRRVVALKVMRRDYASDAEARSRFLREARAAAAIKHDNIVTIHQVGEDQGIPFLAMEFLLGKSLDEWLRPDRRASVPEVLAIGKQILRGLVAAHEAGLIHRDIKPANLWLESPSKRVKVLDFGLARGAEGDFTELTQRGAMLGTPAFMAPEQMRGDPVDHRCDLFSFGCVLYRMTTGRLPFQGNTVFAVMAAVMSEQPPSVSTLNPLVPAPLADLIARLLSKDAAGRPETAKAVLNEILAIEKQGKGGVVATPRASATPTVQGPNRRWRRRLALAGLVASSMLIAIAATVFILRGDNPKPNASANTEMPLKINPPDKNAPARAVDLQAMIDLMSTRKTGNWNTKGYALVGHPAEEGKGFSILLPWVPPASYRLSFDVGRRGRVGQTEGGSLGIALATGSTHLEVRIDEAATGPGSRGKLHSGVTMIDDRRLADREEPHSSMHLPPNKPVHVVCTVTPEAITVTLDGRVVVEEKGNLSKMRRPGPPRPPLGLMGSGPCSFSFSGILLEPLDQDRGHAL